MKPRCWPGCEAYIVAPYLFKEARGRVVKVQREARVTERLDGEHFEHNVPGVVGWVVTGRIPMYDGKICLTAVIADECLTPITPPPGTELDIASVASEDVLHLDKVITLDEPVHV